MRKLAILLSLSLILSVSAAAQSSQSSGNQGLGLIPGDFFYPVESFVEDIEVKVAGLIGGPDFKAKAIANNANETLREAQKLADRNKTEKASEMIQKYSRNLNKSKRLAEKSGDKGLSDRINQISEKDTKTLEEVKKKVPEEAQKGIEKAIGESKSKKGEIGGDLEDKNFTGGKEENLPEKRFNAGRKSEKGKDIVNKTRDALENTSAALPPENNLKDRSGEEGLTGSSEEESDDSSTSWKEEKPFGPEEKDGEKSSSLDGEGPF